MDTSTETISNLQLEEMLFLPAADSNINFNSKNCLQFTKLLIKCIIVCLTM